MNFASIGDGVQQFQLQRQNTALKTSLNRLTNELSSGNASDLIKANNGDTVRFSAVDNRLKVLSSLNFLAAETQLTLSATQVALSNLDTQRSALAEPLILINNESTDLQVAEAARASRDRLDGFIQTLNTRVGDDSLFAGKAVNDAALTSSDTMIANVVAQIGGATDASTIIATIDNWFDDPAGGFATLAYTGDTGDHVVRRLDNTTQVALDARADDPGIKEVLRGAVYASIASEMGGLDKQTKAELLFAGGVQLQSAASDLAQVQGRLGYVEAEVERFSAAHSSEQAALNIARNLMTQADPFETATELQAIQTQLETHYAMTARLSRLNLAEFLR
jgi:flagellar hook-associated protein 3 FlgL